MLSYNSNFDILILTFEFKLSLFQISLYKKQGNITGTEHLFIYFLIDIINKIEY